MLRVIQYLIAIAVICWVPSAFAQEVTADMMTQFKTIAKQINNALIVPAMGTAAAALTLQWIFSHWKDLFNGDFSNSLAKSVGIIAWFAGAIALLKSDGMNMFSSMFDLYLTQAGGLSGVSASDFTPGALITKSVDMIMATNEAFKKASHENWWHIVDNFGGALMLFFANVFTFLAFLMIALSLFVAQLEFWMMFAVAPLAFGLLPLSTFRDQGMAPIKGLISLGFRLLILGVIVAVANQLTLNLMNSMTTTGLPEGDNIFTPMWFYLAGMAGCAMMSLSAGKIASSIASGSASFSGADAIKGGMAMAAGGAAIAAAGAAAVKPAVSAAKGASAGAGALKSGAESVMSRNNMGVNPAATSGGGLGSSAAQARPSLSGGGGASAPSAGGSGSSGSVSGGGSPSAASSGTGGGSSSGSAGDASAAGTGGGSAAQPALSSGSSTGSTGTGGGAGSGSSASGTGQAAAGNTAGNASTAGIGSGSAAQPALSSGSSTGTGGGAGSGSSASGTGQAAAGNTAGNASTAGIGGSGAAAQTAHDKLVQDLAKELKAPPPSALSKLGAASKTAADHGAQDTHAVGVQMHVGKD